MKCQDRVKKKGEINRCETRGGDKRRCRMEMIKKEERRTDGKVEGNRGRSCKLAPLLHALLQITLITDPPCLAITTCSTVTQRAALPLSLPTHSLSSATVLAADIPRKVCCFSN